jgi:trk system potassium uptake protein TrkA
MNVIVVGCGRVGSDLAYRLYRAEHNVTVVDSNEQSFERLKPDFRGRTVTGELLSKEVLERAGIDKADGLAAVTNSDTLNAVVAHTALKIYKVPHVVVRNYDPDLYPVMDLFGFQVVSSTAWGAQRIEELLSGAPVHPVYAAGIGEVKVYELVVPQKWNGSKLGELLGKTGKVLPASLTRTVRSPLPSPNTLLETGDLLTISATEEDIATLRSKLAEKEA